MFSLLVMFAVAAFLIAWVVNGIVGILMGERPRDTGQLWLDAFLRIFAVLELGFIGRILNYVGLNGLPRKIVLFVGLLCVLFFLGKAFHRHEHRDPLMRTYPGHLFQNTNDVAQP